jgi:hypothetical protein
MGDTLCGHGERVDVRPRVCWRAELDSNRTLALGHAFAQREHNADRWIAASAIRLGIPLVSNDTIFKASDG